MKKSRDEVVKELQEILAPEFNVLSIENVNWDPHPYTIGPKHITHAHDNCGGMLGDANTNVVPCAVLHCQLSYDEHKSDTVAMLQLTRQLTNDEANVKIKAAVDVLQENNIYGIALVDTPEKFRIV